MTTTLVDWGNLRGVGAVTAVAATGAPTAAPSGSVGVYTDRFPRVRTFLRYSGTVNACAIKLWLRDAVSGDWYEGPSTDDLDPLTPGGASPVNEVREWAVGPHQEAYWQVTTVSGGGAVEVRAQGVEA